MRTEEEQRALNFNLSLKRRAAACRLREYRLRGKDAEKKGLQDRMEAVKTKESYEQREKIQFDKHAEREALCNGTTANG